MRVGGKLLDVRVMLCASRRIVVKFPRCAWAERREREEAGKLLQSRSVRVGGREVARVKVCEYERVEEGRQAVRQQTEWWRVRAEKRQAAKTWGIDWLLPVPRRP